MKVAAYTDQRLLDLKLLVVLLGSDTELIVFTSEQAYWDYWCLLHEDVRRQYILQGFNQIRWNGAWRHALRYKGVLLICVPPKKPNSSFAETARMEGVNLPGITE